METSYHIIGKRIMSSSKIFLKFLLVIILVLSVIFTGALLLAKWKNRSILAKMEIELQGLRKLTPQEHYQREERKLIEKIELAEENLRRADSLLPFF